MCSAAHTPHQLLWPCWSGLHHSVSHRCSGVWGMFPSYPGLQKQIEGKTNRKKVLKLDGSFYSTKSHGACVESHTKGYFFRVSTCSHMAKGLLKWEQTCWRHPEWAEWLSAHHAVKKPKAAPLCFDGRGPFICHFPLDMSWMHRTMGTSGHSHSQRWGNLQLWRGWVFCGCRVPD